MLRVFLFMLLIAFGSVLLALGPGALKPYHIEDALPWAFGGLCVAAFSFALWLSARLFELKERLDFIAICLTQAEIEMNNLIMRGMDQSGAKARIPVRQEWARLVPPTPMILVNAKYENPVLPMLEMYEKDLMSGKGDKRLINQTALLLRDVLNASIAGAKIRIEAEFRNSGKLPHVAAGLAELIGVHDFDTQRGRFPRNCGENWRLVRHVVYRRGFPRRLLMVEEDKATGAKVAHTGMAVLDRLTAHYV